MGATPGTVLAANAGESEATKRKRLVLVGGGHSHLQVIKGLNHASRPKDIDIVLIDVTNRPCYSGMVPSAVAGIYSPDETLIDLIPLSEWSKIDFVRDRVVDIDMDEKLVITNGNKKISFDAISVDIGSTSRGLIDITGAKEYTIPTRPITELVRRVEEATNFLKEKKNESNEDGHQCISNIVVVGGGAAGIELSMAVSERWKAILGETNIAVTVLNSFDTLFPDETLLNREALMEQLKERGIDVVNNAKVVQVDEHSLLLDSGERFEFTYCLWATGADCHFEIVSTLRQRGLAISENGWIQVNECFQSVSHPFVFAAGDCCSMKIPGSSRSLPKAGVYAVRAGPILIENLTLFLDNKVGNSKNGREHVGEWNTGTGYTPLKAYKPQKDFLKLLACGDGKALGFRFGIPFYGKWVFELKDAIDKSFMELFHRENLPELVEGEPYDTSQYDAYSNRSPPIASIEAAILLQRRDDDVDFQKAWDVLRDMAEDKGYRDEVLKEIELGVSSLESLSV